VIELEKIKICFENCGGIVSPSDFVIIARTYAYSFLRLMVFYFELVGLSMNFGNIVKLGRPTFSEIFVQPPAWLLYSFLARIFLQWVGLEKKHRKRNHGMYIMKIVDKKVENLTQGRWIPIESVKSWNYFRNYGHKIGRMSCIDSDKSNSVY